MRGLLDKILKLSNEAAPFVEAILVDARGSVPSDIGARIIVNQDGLVAGTIGGGKVEAKAIQQARDLLNEKVEQKNNFVTWNLQKDVGMTCGGEVKIFFQVHNLPNWKVAVFGAGHVSQKLIPLLCTLDCLVYCIDPRQEWLAQLPEHPNLRKLQADQPFRIVSELPSDTYFALMTQGHATDFPVLKEILTTRKPPYLGVIGSKSKALVLKKELSDAGVAEELRNSFLCPIGLPFGNNSPNEIAISVVAQLLSHRDNNKDIAKQ